MHDLVPLKYHPLLQLSRTLAEIALYAQMKMQTESRLRSGEALITKFNDQLPVRFHHSTIILLTGCLDCIPTARQKLQLSESSSTLASVQ